MISPIMLGKDGRPLLRRKQLARKHRLTYSAIRSLHDAKEEADRLVPHHQGPDGAYWYDQAEFEQLKARLEIVPEVGKAKKRPQLSRGDAAAKAFEMFKAGRSNREIVCAIRRAPGEVAKLRREYAQTDEFLLRAEAVEVIVSTLASAGLSAELSELPVTIDFLCQRSMAFAEQATTTERKNEQATNQEDHHQEDHHQEGRPTKRTD